MLLQAAADSLYGCVCNTCTTRHTQGPRGLNILVEKMSIWNPGKEHQYIWGVSNGVRINTLESTINVINIFYRMCVRVILVHSSELDSR